MFLLKEDLWSVTSKTSLGSTTPIHQSTWDSKDQIARLFICLGERFVEV
jgi:hypothetical protein